MAARLAGGPAMTDLGLAAGVGILGVFALGGGLVLGVFDLGGMPLGVFDLGREAGGALLGVFDRGWAAAFLWALSSSSRYRCP